MLKKIVMPCVGGEGCPLATPQDPPWQGRVCRHTRAVCGAAPRTGWLIPPLPERSICLNHRGSTHEDPFDLELDLFDLNNH